jgi:A/G-specific adenine glycosylase
LFECADLITNRHAGQVPDTLPGLLALPGVGGYTARAVAAFAFGHRVPVVDTNVRRVVARLGGRPDAGPTTTAADLLATEALLPVRPADAVRASAALMELGALVCTARAPRCGSCPVRRHCTWSQAGRPEAGQPVRRSQRYAGTDRQVRGLLLEVLRCADGPVPAASLDLTWLDAVQRHRALAGLLADGLVSRTTGDRYLLGGGQPPQD